MPSAKQIFFTPVDEAALSAALVDRFPDIRFAQHDYKSPEGWRDLANIQSANDRHEVHIFIPSPDWKPKFVERKLYKGTSCAIANWPDETMIFRRSDLRNMTNEPGKGPNRPVISHGILQVGITDTMSKAQIAFRGKVWRMLSKISTCHLLGFVGPPDYKSWQELDTRIFCAGNDAVRWALEDESRCFEANILFRPPPS